MFTRNKIKEKKKKQRIFWVFASIFPDWIKKKPSLQNWIGMFWHINPMDVLAPQVTTKTQIVLKVSLILISN